MHYENADEFCLKEPLTLESILKIVSIIFVLIPLLMRMEEYFYDFVNNNMSFPKD